MRIISQDGAIDVPYENADLERKGKIIYVWTLDNVYGSFASYSTEEKAIKAMEMCRKRYTQYIFNKRVVPVAANDLARIPLEEAEKVRDQISETFIFQFPKEEEFEGE
jgi:hypothetical protein